MTDPKTRSLTPPTPPDSSFASTASSPLSSAHLLDDPVKEQAAARSLPEASGGDADDEDGDKRGLAAPSSPHSQAHGTDAASLSPPTPRPEAAATQPRHTWARLIGESINLLAEVLHSLMIICRAAIHTAAANPITLYILGWAFAIPLVLVALFYFLPRASVAVVIKSAQAISGYLSGLARAVWDCCEAGFGYLSWLFCALWDRCSGVFYTAYSFTFVALGTRLGLIPPTVLPPLGDECGPILPPIQRAPLPHVDGLVLAERVAEPHVSELRRSLDAKPDPSQHQLHLLVGLDLQFPSVLFDPVVAVNISAIAADNERLGNRMFNSLQKERDALCGLRRALRDKPAGGLLQKPPASPASLKNAATSSRWCTAWQTVRTTILTWIQPSAKSHLLRQVDKLESILESSRAQRKEWNRKVPTSDLSRVQFLDVPVCHASQMLNDIRFKLEAKTDELPPPTAIDAADNDGTHAPASSSDAAALAELSKTLTGLRVVQANFGHMCQFASASRNVVTEVVSKVADDGRWYDGTLNALKKIRGRAEANSLTDPPSVLAFEREMDDMASRILERMKYWEEEQRSG